ncbi:MAG TPA: L-serine ammonia-lyase [Ilumatobacteraceae bacterium]|nr:L-serine ammonia-lyase [Ilumatobacteraceae bacterium]
MTISVFELFRIGIGPSSSHTVGPMRAAGRFLERVATEHGLDRVSGVRTHLYGSLAATGVGHGTVSAILLGLSGAQPQSVDPDEIPGLLAAIADDGALRLLGTTSVPFDVDADVVMHTDETLPSHPNGMMFVASGIDGAVLFSHRYYSIGGGFVVDDDEVDAPVVASQSAVPFPYGSAEELLAMCVANGASISDIKMANEHTQRSTAEVREQLLDIWQAMRECVDRGCRNEGELPGGLQVQRRAASLHRTLLADDGSIDPLATLDWVNLFALAVNEENAAGGRVVTAPTNGAAGIVPAVLHYYAKFVPGADDDGIVEFLLTAGAIGALFKMNASISGAEVGCQGEVGSACAMAAAGLAHVMGGTPQQVENAAEIALEHNLGLTCDPIGGLVQVPCIERNAMASMKAINAARLALHGDGTHLVSLDQAITTMRDTGRDMHEKYKETARGGLAVTFRNSRGGDTAVHIPVNVVEC